MLWRVVLPFFLAGEENLTVDPYPVIFQLEIFGS
jgi:hypothetical protein